MIAGMIFNVFSDIVIDLLYCAFLLFILDLAVSLMFDVDLVWELRKLFQRIFGGDGRKEKNKSDS